MKNNLFVSSKFLLFGLLLANVEGVLTRAWKAKGVLFNKEIITIL